ncbi:CGNR zinc finger domain-containing protein [Promicromonospora sp. NPDC057488]|uniref:CGNR zinc finger domain-containing protein n=1 Tax=Promicromonospora sp. NPDC057488 TaxID=3346147 RepID=UPI0036722337
MPERLLVGETMSLDLVNTEWIDHGNMVDFLAADGAPELWFREYGFDPAEQDVDALRASRSAIRSLLDSPGADADARLNDVLSHGYESTRVTDGRPETAPTADAGWGAAWSAARAFTELLTAHPDRIRQCAHPDCVLWFYDTSRNGRRRWHSMETCGARTKSARHYRRYVSDETARADGTAPVA